ncbi:hypothetical protein RFI_08710 [Reticulomyxa filosa]|uniref:Uncharacterized protein n=1 Tax=Reticulomyxa filosa TaxID=46433 RepID=X6NR97_RETFI|nr:hypothetical protein RFI_08710 [Reticulomyxa filosa]|eukprot:ETO28423.1 hypothetical protein RFI_08710 [Reticulomyxa filosa]
MNGLTKLGVVLENPGDDDNPLPEKKKVSFESDSSENKPLSGEVTIDNEKIESLLYPDGTVDVAQLKNQNIALMFIHCDAYAKQKILCDVLPSCPLRTLGGGEKKKICKDMLRLEKQYEDARKRWEKREQEYEMDQKKMIKVERYYKQEIEKLRSKVMPIKTIEIDKGKNIVVSTPTVEQMIALLINVDQLLSLFFINK